MNAIEQAKEALRACRLYVWRVNNMLMAAENDNEEECVLIRKADKAIAALDKHIGNLTASQVAALDTVPSVEDWRELSSPEDLTLTDEPQSLESLWAELTDDQTKALLAEVTRADNMRLHLGEMTAQEMRTAKAAIQWAFYELSRKR